MLPGARGDDDGHVVFVEHVHTADWVLDGGREAHECLERDPLALSHRRRALPAVVLEPRLHHPSLAVAAASVGGSTRCGLGAPEVDLQIAVGNLVRLAQMHKMSSLQQHRAVAEAVQRTHVVRYKHDRSPLVAHSVEDVKALLLKGGVADGEHLIDEQDVGVDLDRDRECQPDVHAGGVVLELQLLELAQFGEVDHLVDAPTRLTRGEAHHDAVQHDVVACREVLVEADAELDER